MRRLPSSAEGELPAFLKVDLLIVLLHGGVSVEDLDQMGIRIERVKAFLCQTGRSSIHHDSDVVVLEDLGDLYNNLAAQQFNARVVQVGRYQPQRAIITNPDKNT